MFSFNIDTDNVRSYIMVVQFNPAQTFQTVKGFVTKTAGDAGKFAAETAGDAKKLATDVFELAKTNKRGTIAIAGAAAVGVGALALIAKGIKSIIAEHKAKKAINAFFKDSEV